MKMNEIYGTIGTASLVIVAVAAGLAVNAGAYEMRSNRENRVRVDVKPVQLTPGQPARFASANEYAFRNTWRRYGCSQFP